MTCYFFYTYIYNICVLYLYEYISKWVYHNDGMMGSMRYTSMCPFRYIIPNQSVCSNHPLVCCIKDLFQQVFLGWFGLWFLNLAPLRRCFFCWIPLLFTRQWTFMNLSVIPSGHWTLFSCLLFRLPFSKDLMFGNCHWTCDYCITKHFHVNDEHFGHEL